MSASWPQQAGDLARNQINRHRFKEIHSKNILNFASQ